MNSFLEGRVIQRIYNSTYTQPPNPALSWEERFAATDSLTLGAASKELLVRLGEYGFSSSLDVLVDAVDANGSLYEDRRFPEGGTMYTGLNLLGVLLHKEKDIVIRCLSDSARREDFIGTLAVLGQVMSTLAARGDFGILIENRTYWSRGLKDLYEASKGLQNPLDIIHGSAFEG